VPRASLEGMAEGELKTEEFTRWWREPGEHELRQLWNSPGLEAHRANRPTACVLPQKPPSRIARRYGRTRTEPPRSSFMPRKTSSYPPDSRSLDGARGRRWNRQLLPDRGHLLGVGGQRFANALSDLVARRSKRDNAGHGSSIRASHSVSSSAAGEMER
jgi:hypothetical protein